MASTREGVIWRQPSVCCPAQGASKQPRWRTRRAAASHRPPRARPGGRARFPGRRAGAQPVARPEPRSGREPLARGQRPRRGGPVDRGRGLRPDGRVARGGRRGRACRRDRAYRAGRDRSRAAGRPRRARSPGGRGVRHLPRRGTVAPRALRRAIGRRSPGASAAPGALARGRHVRLPRRRGSRAARRRPPLRPGRLVSSAPSARSSGTRVG